MLRVLSDQILIYCRVWLHLFDFSPLCVLRANLKGCVAFGEQKPIKGSNGRHKGEGPSLNEDDDDDVKCQRLLCEEKKQKGIFFVNCIVGEVLNLEFRKVSFQSQKC